MGNKQLSNQYPYIKCAETNEELAIKAAHGDNESLNKLYFAVAPLVHKFIRPYLTYCNKQVAPEDLYQSGYFAVIKAVKYFSPDKGFKFNSYLENCVKVVCHEELGFRKKQVETVSLETPMPDNEGGLTLEDTVEDPEADAFKFCELNDMRIIVRREIERLPSKEQCVIYAIFYENKTMEETASELGWDIQNTSKIRHLAYKHLRQSEAMQELRKAYTWREKDGPEEYMEFMEADNLFNDSGLTPI